MLKAGDPPSHEVLAELMEAAAVHKCAPRAESLFQWFREQNPELGEIWRLAEQDLGGGLTFFDLADLRRAFEEWTELDDEKRVTTATRLCQLDPWTAEMWARLERTAADANLRWPNDARKAARYHRQMTELLEGGDVDVFVEDFGRAVGVHVAILEHRLHRGEGDLRRAKEVHDELRRRAAMPPVKVLPRETLKTQGE